MWGCAAGYYDREPYDDGGVEGAGGEGEGGGGGGGDDGGGGGGAAGDDDADSALATTTTTTPRATTRSSRWRGRASRRARSAGFEHRHLKPGLWLRCGRARTNGVVVNYNGQFTLR